MVPLSINVIEVKSVVQRLNALEFKCGVAKIPAATSGGGAIQRNDDDDDDDDDFDLFGDTDEEETAKVLEERKNQISKKSSSKYMLNLVTRNYCQMNWYRTTILKTKPSDYLHSQNLIHYAL